MEIAGRFRVVRRGDHAVPAVPPRPILDRGSKLDIRVWRHSSEAQPLLLVNASRKQGKAVERNRFRRRVRMAFLDILRRTPAGWDRSAIVWIRPAKGQPKGCRIPYAEIVAQLQMALNRWEPR